MAIHVIHVTYVILLPFSLIFFKITLFIWYVEWDARWRMLARWSWVLAKICSFPQIQLLEKFLSSMINFYYQQLKNCRVRDIFLITSRKQFSKDCASCLNRIDFDVIPSSIECLFLFEQMVFSDVFISPLLLSLLLEP